MASSPKPHTYGDTLTVPTFHPPRQPLALISAPLTSSSSSSSSSSYQPHPASCNPTFTPSFTSPSIPNPALDLVQCTKSSSNHEPNLNYQSTLEGSACQITIGLLSTPAAAAHERDGVQSPTEDILQTPTPSQSLIHQSSSHIHSHFKSDPVQLGSNPISFIQPTPISPLVGSPLQLFTVPFPDHLSSFESSNICLPSGSIPIFYTEPISIVSSLMTTTTLPSPIPSRSLLSPSSQPDLRTSAINSIQSYLSSPFNRSSTTPTNFESQSGPSTLNPKSWNRRSTIIGGAHQEAPMLSTGPDYRQFITAIKESDKREQARAMSAIVNPLGRDSCPRPTISQGSQKKPWQCVQDHYRGTQLSHPQSRSSLIPHHTSPYSVPDPDSQSYLSPLSINSTHHSNTNLHCQEHGPLATTELKSHKALTSIPITSLGINLGSLNPDTIRNQPVSSPLTTPNLKIKRSLHVAKLSKLLTKLRKDDLHPHSRQDSPQSLPIPSSLSPTTLSSIRSPSFVPSPAISDHQVWPSPLSTPIEPLSVPQTPPPPSKPVITKKPSFTQRIARRLSLSNRRTDPSDRLFDASDALPLPLPSPELLTYLSHLTSHSPAPSPNTSDYPNRPTLNHSLPLPNPLADILSSALHTPSRSFKTDSDSSVDSPKTDGLFYQLPRRSESTTDSVPGFELVDDIIKPPPLYQSPTTLHSEGDPLSTESLQSQSIIQHSQIYLGLLTPSTSDRDLTNTLEGFRAQTYTPASPSPALSYSTDQACSSKSHFPACLPSPALSDIHTPGSPIDPSLLPTPSPPQSLGHKALPPLEVYKPTNTNVLPSSTTLTGLPADLVVHPLSKRSYTALSPTHLYPSSVVSTDSLGIHHTALSSCTDGQSPKENPSSIWWASSESEMAHSVISQTSLGGSSYNSNLQPPRSSLSTQLGSGPQTGSRAVGRPSTNRIGSQSNQSGYIRTGSLVSAFDKRGGKRRGSRSDSDDSSDVHPSAAMSWVNEPEATEEGESDDSDDVPLGQRHPDALKVQKELREDRAKRHARRKAREAAKAEMEAKTIALVQRQKQAEEEQQQQQQRKAAAQRELDLAATAAKLAMKFNGNDADDNKPLGQLKREKSCSRSKPGFSDPFAISPDELSRRLETVQLRDRTKAEHRPVPLSIKTDITSEPGEPIGHPLLPQTDASVRSRKGSHAQLEPLSPFIKESVLTMGDSNESALDDDEIEIGARELAILLQSQPMNHTASIRSRQDSARHDHPHSHHRSPQLNGLDSKPILSPASAPAGPASREGWKRDQTVNAPASSYRSNRDTPDTRPPVSRPDGLRRGNTTAVRQRGTSPSTSPLIPANAFIHPIPGPSTILSRAKSQARKPNALTIPSQPVPSDNNMLSPTSASSPTFPCSLPRQSRRILQKVAIVDQSHTMMIEIDEKTMAADLLKEIEQRGELGRQTKGFGEWAVFEVWQDLGIERPIREIEPILSVVDTWTVNTDNSYLLIQKHALASLAIQNRTITAGSWGSNLVCELKPGKWSKKYVMLKENAIYICANEKGKDEMFLCTLANFDVFYVASSVVKAPRPFAFGVKSLDKFSFFETKSDFVHYFACKDENTQLEWIRRIYDARTFHIMSNSAPIHESANRTKTSDPPGSILIRASTEHGPSRPKVPNGTNGLRAGSSLQNGPPTTDYRRPSKPSDLPIQARSRNPSANGAAGVSRRPTLIEPDSNSKFRSGTLLGDLKSGVPSTNGRPAQPVLPSHITPAIPTNLTTNVRGWEQMGPTERKEHLAEVQARAKTDGKTLLRFEEINPFGSGGGALRKLSVPDGGPEFHNMKSLSRSRTLNSKKP
ncbi:hypothetical protein CROQUDRAFT_671605 [Cronartium quercuum f. sp. fusiforme G11]|uniref:PH domain-containing protein n=1 Tax=Cronartium quercuum f. sp. fusiforme G11 TaxID=708437 RepID=A0A9P6NLC9_9BASI|nr:hypothetical protein CROQUDRAFT_671605 [Cronartium quercuum f. sp. fusiforme G11]